MSGSASHPAGTSVTPADAAEAPPYAPYANHGRTRAAWALVALVVLGAVVVGVGMFCSLAVLAWCGVGVMVLGLLVGLALRMTGKGQPLTDPARRQ